MLSGSEVSVELNGPGSAGSFTRQGEEERDRDRGREGRVGGDRKSLVSLDKRQNVRQRTHGQV